MDVAQRCSTKIGHGSKLLTPKMDDQMTRTYSKNLQFPPYSLAFLPYPCWLRGVVSHDICLRHERRGTVCNELDQGMSSGRLHLSPISKHRMVRFCFCSMHGNVNGNNIPHLSNSPKEIDLLGYLLLGCLKSPVTRNSFSSKLPELNCLQLAAPCNMILGFGRNGVL